MNDAQIWATIIGGFVLAWHAINVWGRARVSRDVLRAKSKVEHNGAQEALRS